MFSHRISEYCSPKKEIAREREGKKEIVFYFVSKEIGKK